MEAEGYTAAGVSHHPEYQKCEDADMLARLPAVQVRGLGTEGEETHHLYYPGLDTCHKENEPWEALRRMHRLQWYFQSVQHVGT